MAAEAAGDEASSGALLTTRKLTVLDLPVETQREILSQCSQSDLICLALVSKHFHELASAQLYRSFNIIFPDDDDLTFESPIDGLAGGLDTFTTSEYNYAKHLKELSMDTLSTGPKGEHAYKSYLYSASCGKFLNTLLYLTLKKAKALESFRWNIRVELSRPVYRELHRIKSLKKLHIRMQAGESYYNIPPPLPVSPEAPSGPTPVSNHWTDIPPPPPPPVPLSAMPFIVDLPVPVITNYVPMNGPPPALTAPSKQAAKTRASRRGLESKEPPTLSAFKRLSSLSVLDIDNLDMVTELKACVQSSVSTLKELNLSLSDSLASQSRKPPPDSDPDDSDVEDEFQVVPASPNGSMDGSGPAKTFRAQEERKLQEAMLGRIFGVEPSISKKAQFQKNSGEDAATDSKGKGKESDASARNPREGFVTSLRDVSTRLMTAINGSRTFSTTQQDILDVIEKAARKYVDSVDAPTPDAKDSASNKPEAGTSKEGENQTSDSSADTAQSSETTNEPAHGQESESQSQATGGTKQPRTGKGDDLSPEDIDIEHSDSDYDLDEDSGLQTPKDKGEKSAELQPASESSMPHVSDPSASAAPAAASPDAGTSTRREKQAPELPVPKWDFDALMAKLRGFQNQADELGQRIKEMIEGTNTDPAHLQEAEARLAELMHFSSKLKSKIKMIEHEVENVESRIPRLSAHVEQSQRSMDDYIRTTRGLALETLSFHLVPVKPSVLSRAIDMRCLKNLTLLNVGNQAPIWNLLSKENKVHPLALRNVFTDNVSTAFLTCMSHLEELHELFMLERSPKHKPESFAPKTTVTIDQIRRLVLKKHMHTLKRLMIKDDSSSPNWDANQKTMILICNRGCQLEELAVSMNIHAVHAFMQYFAGLVKLRAINILRFRNNDTCIWVMREILKFIVDNLSHHPELKLEWIAMEDDRIDRVIRPHEGASKPEKESKSNHKGKGVATTPPIPWIGNSSTELPILPTGDWASDSESDEDDDDAYNNGKRLRCKTVGPLQFYDVWGVKIFEKEIRSGRL